jgi:hypothetical protein
VQSLAERDLSEVDYLYLWVDGIHLKVWLEQEKLCLLVMIGARGWLQGTGRCDRRVPGVHRVVG